MPAGAPKRASPTARLCSHRVVYEKKHTGRACLAQSGGGAAPRECRWDTEQAVSQEDVELVRQLLAPFEQGDIAPIFRDDAISTAMQVALADTLAPDFECDFVRDDVGRATYSGVAGLRTAW